MQSKTGDVESYISALEDKIVEIVNKKLRNNSENVLIDSKNFNSSIVIIIRDYKAELIRVIKNISGEIKIDPVPLESLPSDDSERDTSIGYNLPTTVFKNGKEWRLCLDSYSGNKKNIAFLKYIEDETISDEEKSVWLKALILHKNLKNVLDDEMIKELFIVCDKKELGEIITVLFKSLIKDKKLENYRHMVRLLENIEFEILPSRKDYYYGFVVSPDELENNESRLLLLKNNSEYCFYKNFNLIETIDDGDVELDKIDKIGLLLNGNLKPVNKQEGIIFFKDEEELRRRVIAGYISFRHCRMEIEFNSLKERSNKLSKEYYFLLEKKEKLEQLITSLEEDFEKFDK